MARIRSIKPAFFRHEELFEAEKETGLPLRLAFAGLWTAADREGRFKWSARNLKLDCLPYDDVDFSRVLDALTTRGFIKKYAVNSGEYGFIPSWKSHQVINNRESASELPEPSENNALTRASRVADACPTPLEYAPVEGKGREGKGEDAAEAAHSSNLEADYFRRVKEICGPNSGGLAKKVLTAKNNSVAQARAAIEKASETSDPREYLGAIIRGRGGGADDLRARGEAW